jgi:putative membrane protein
MKRSLEQMRTLLSIERTLLAYIRSALTFFVAGATLVQFFRHGAFQISGYVLIPFALATFVFGILRYRRLRSRVLPVEDED